MSECVKCGYTRKAGDTAPAGECPRCGVIYAKVKTQRVESPPPSPPETEKAEHAKVDPIPPRIRPEPLDASQKKYLIIMLVMGLAIGYFAGREHLKYQMRTAMTDAALEFKKTMGAVFGGGQLPKEPEKKTPAKAPEKVVKPEAPPPITAVLIKKGFFDGEYGQDEITFTVQFTNSTGKDVRAFDGVLSFTDLLDNEIMAAKLAVNDPVRSHATHDWNGSIDYNQFMDKHQRLKSAEQQNIKINFALRKVLFEDGEVKEF